MSETKYICDLNVTPEVEKAYAELREYQTRRDEQQEFMKKMQKGLLEEHEARWEGLFNAVKRAGKLPEDYSYKDWGIMLGGGQKENEMATQFFIKPTDKSDLTIGDAIKKFFT